MKSTSKLQLLKGKSIDFSETGWFIPPKGELLGFKSMKEPQVTLRTPGARCWTKGGRRTSRVLSPPSSCCWWESHLRANRPVTFSWPRFDFGFVMNVDLFDIWGHGEGCKRLTSSRSFRQVRNVNAVSLLGIRAPHGSSDSLARVRGLSSNGPG